MGDNLSDKQVINGPRSVGWVEAGSMRFRNEAGEYSECFGLPKPNNQRTHEYLQACSFVLVYFGPPRNGLMTPSGSDYVAGCWVSADGEGLENPPRTASVQWLSRLHPTYESYRMRTLCFKETSGGDAIHWSNDSIVQNGPYIERLSDRFCSIETKHHGNQWLIYHRINRYGR